MRIATTLFFICIHFTTYAQSNKQLSVAFVNTASAHPFQKFGDFVTSMHHPGFELGYTFNWNTRKNHDWYQAIKAGYFYHRFVQPAIPLYTDIGYRYKFGNRWSA